MKTRFTCLVSALAVMASSFTAQASNRPEWDDPAVLQVNALPTATVGGPHTTGPGHESGREFLRAFLEHVTLTFTLPSQGVSLLKLEWSAGDPASLPADADFVH